MTYRRTWFSCVLWFLYTILCIALLTIVGEVWVQYFTGVSGDSLIVSGLFLILTASVLYWIIRGIAAQIRKKCVRKERAAQIWSFIVFLLIMVGGVFIRIICLNDQLSVVESGRIADVSGMEFYDMATVTEDSLIPSMDYGISYLYVMLLSAVLAFLGNKVASVIYLQVFLQTIGMVLAYAVTRKIAGKLPACVALIYLACSLSCLRMLVCFGPEWLFFVFYMFGMLITVSFVKSYLANRLRKPLAVIGAVVIGAVIGGLTYLDLTAASLLIVILAVAVGKKIRRENTPVYNSGGISAAVILTTVFVCAAVWFGATGIVSSIKGTDCIGEVLDRLWLCYRNSIPFTNMQPYFSDVYLIGVLIVPAFFLAFEFFRSRKEQNYMLWILLCLLAAPTPMAVYGEHGFGVLSLYIWAVLAGLGLQNCLFGGREQVMQDVIKEINTAIEAQPPEMTENQVPEPHYIENPLPLPKKHVAKEMDYQYAVKESDMKYDVEVAENDDFDL